MKLRIVFVVFSLLLIGCEPQPTHDLLPTPSPDEVRQILDTAEFPSGWGGTWPVDEEHDYRQAEVEYFLATARLTESLEEYTPFSLSFWRFADSEDAEQFFNEQLDFRFRTDLAGGLARDAENYVPITIEANRADRFHFACVMWVRHGEICRAFGQYGRCVVYVFTGITSLMTLEDLKRVLENAVDVNTPQVVGCGNG